MIQSVVVVLDCPVPTVSDDVEVPFIPVLPLREVVPIEPLVPVDPEVRESELIPDVEVPEPEP